MKVTAYRNNGQGQAYLICIMNDFYYSWYEMSENPWAPNGVCIHLGDTANAEDVGKEIELYDLPSSVLAQIIRMIEREFEDE